MKKHFADHWALVQLIMDNHNVSKHRTMIFRGGTSRNDPPDGFFDALPEDDIARQILAPMKEVVLARKPKLATGERPLESTELTTLESLIEEFHRFINDAWCLDHEDAKAHIHLRDETTCRRT